MKLPAAQISGAVTDRFIARIVVHMSDLGSEKGKIMSRVGLICESGNNSLLTKNRGRTV